MAGKRNVGTTERGSVIMSGRLSVLEQLERTIKSDRPWEKVRESAESWRKCGVQRVGVSVDRRIRRDRV
jgi:hypothetical protein